MLFRYLGRDKEGKSLQGELEAKNIAEAETRLKERGIYVLEIKRRISWTLNIQRKVKTSDLIFLLRQLAFLIKSGITLNTALEITESNIKDPALKTTIRKLREETTTGASLSSSLSKAGPGFPRMVIEIIRVGEATGNLSEVIARLADFLTREEDLKTKVKQVMSYPMITLLLVGGAVTFLLVTIVPVFTRLYKSANVTLPLPTRILVALSAIISGYWWLIIPSAIIIYFLFKKIINTEKGRMVWDRILFRLPSSIGNIYRLSIFLRISSTLETLLRSGLLLTESLLFLSRASGNKVTENAILYCREGVIQGRSISVVLRESRIFPQLFVRMIAVGEEGGNLEEMLGRMVEYFEKELDNEMKRFVTLLEPTLTLILGVIVGFVALSIYLPIFDMIRLVR
ncbi:MAG: Type II secretion system protein F [candidate division WS2 bacterium]|uniref:Type II secretion system protein F n=1 Tax=Psychracetigena formicireducens TaxID=2986056 RepID=A0A9E2BII6_PSYF1|nr:Type II secretion system protein F [Candidatus Psychracetigena formicireducens]